MEPKKKVGKIARVLGKAIETVASLGKGDDSGVITPPAPLDNRNAYKAARDKFSGSFEDMLVRISGQRKPKKRQEEMNGLLSSARRERDHLTAFIMLILLRTYDTSINVAQRLRFESLVVRNFNLRLKKLGTEEFPLVMYLVEQVPQNGVCTPFSPLRYLLEMRAIELVMLDATLAKRYVVPQTIDYLKSFDCDTLYRLWKNMADSVSRAYRFKVLDT